MGYGNVNRDDWKRLRGLKRLLHEGVNRGASFVEKHHRQTAEKPFDALESIDPVAGPTKIIRRMHDGVVSLTYESIRALNRATEVADDWVMDRLEPSDGDAETGTEEDSKAPTDEGGKV